MLDLDRIEGVLVVLGSLLKKGLIHGRVTTVTGYTMEKSLENTGNHQQQLLPVQISDIM